MSESILIDTARFIDEARSLAGSLGVSQLGSRVAEHELLYESAAAVHYRISGGRDELQRPFFDVLVQADLQLICQCCLSPMAFALDDNARVVLFKNEAALDKAMLDDVDLEGMLWAAEFDGVTLLADQVILALPVAPRHEVCDESLGVAAAEVGAKTAAESDVASHDPAQLPLNVKPKPDADDKASTAEGRSHPFAKLATLKRQSK